MLEDSFSADEDGGGSSRIIGMSKGMDPASPLIQTSSGDNTDAAAKASSTPFFPKLSYFFLYLS